MLGTLPSSHDQGKNVASARQNVYAIAISNLIVFLVCASHVVHYISIALGYSPGPFGLKQANLNEAGREHEVSSCP